MVKNKLKVFEFYNRIYSTDDNRQGVIFKITYKPKKTKNKISKSIESRAQSIEIFHYVNISIWNTLFLS